MSTYLVTGGAGFIGSHLADKLLSDNNRVVILDDLSLGRKSNLDKALQNSNCVFIEGNILDESLLNSIRYLQKEVERYFLPEKALEVYMKDKCLI